MVRPHWQTIDCPTCGATISAENGFSRVLRNKIKRTGRTGRYCYGDLDYVAHQYRTFEGRRYQFVMVIEAKPNLGEVFPAQGDTLYLWDQVSRNQRHPATDGQQWWRSTPPQIVFSQHEGRLILARSWGAHVLRFSGNEPTEGEPIFWDGHAVTFDQLLDLLEFELHPDTREPIDWDEQREEYRRARESFLAYRDGWMKNHE